MFLLAQCPCASFLLTPLGFKKTELTVSLAKETVEGWGFITREWLAFKMPGLKFSLHTEGYGPTRGTGILVDGKNEIQVK